MGMYDMLVIEYTIPDINPHTLQSTKWQTKDFDNMLETYCLDENGELHNWLGKVRFSGVLNFYGYKNNNFDEKNWLEFWASFDEGKLVYISNRPIEYSSKEVMPM